jgi:hypothetical protein
MTAENIMWLGGDQPRHLYYINNLLKHFDIKAGIIQERGNPMPPLPDGLRFTDRNNFELHFRTRIEKEKQYFGDQHAPQIELLRVNKETLNNEASAEFVKKFKPDMVLIFGTGMIKEPLLSALPKEKINLHLGISPRYRGAATLFWPFYNLEPQWAGSTFHYIVDTPDGGNIIHQVTPTLEWNEGLTNVPGSAYRTYGQRDGIHDVACKTVVQSTIEAVALLKKYPDWQTFTQKPESGKNYLESDFKPQFLRMIYQDFNGEMVKAYLQGELPGKKPDLKRQNI